MAELRQIFTRMREIIDMLDNSTALTFDCVVNLFHRDVADDSNADCATLKIACKSVYLV